MTRIWQILSVGYFEWKGLLQVILILDSTLGSPIITVSKHFLITFPQLVSILFTMVPQLLL